MAAADRGWEHFEVEADVGVRAWGPSRGVAFAEAAAGVLALIVDPASVNARESREVRAQAESPEARKLIDFIGLPWDEACLNFHEAGSTVRTFSRRQVRNPIYKSSVERWRRYEQELQPLLSALGDLAQ